MSNGITSTPRTAKDRLAAVNQHLYPQGTSASLKAPEVKSPSQSLEEERANPSFNVRDLTYLLEGGQRNTEIREQMMMELERNPVFRMYDIHDLTKDQLRERTMEKFRAQLYYLTNEPVPLFRTRMELVSLIDPGFWTRFGVHFGLFFGALQGSATPSQFQFWVSKGALSLNGMVGCFAMTELGHGSNLAGLETTATFDEAADQFIIHTPTITATKWWIGGAAHTATHAVVFAQLIIRGKRHGVKSFVVQLRDPKDYSLMPGVDIGDIGKKMGRDGIDNGWIQFTNVRIPRGHMLMKHTKLARDGTVKEPPLQQLTYGALLQGRVAMVVDAGNVSKKALSIALRYAAIRRQFSVTPGEPETKLLDYKIHQRRLIPLLAQAFAMHFTGQEVQKLYLEMMDRLESTKPSDPDLQEALEILKETHGTSAGLKAFCTWNCLNTIEQCRQACGGHGYSAYTGLAGMYQDFAVQCTWEGDNTILTLQLGRYLISCYVEAKGGKRQTAGIHYLNDIENIIGKKCSNDDPTGLETIFEAWSVITANLVKKAGDDFEGAVKSGMSHDRSYEECSQQRLYAAKFHSYFSLYRYFIRAVKSAPKELQKVLQPLAQLYGLFNIEDNAGAFLQYGYYSPNQMDKIRIRVNELCGSIRKDAILLVDSFNYSDYIINSPLGRYDGDIYRAYFEQVKRANPPSEHPYFDKIIKPLLERNIAGGDPEDETGGLDEDDDDE